MQNRKTLLLVLCGLLVILLALIGVLAVVMLSGDSADSNVYQEQLDIGDKYLENEDYEQAIAAYRAAIDADPAAEEPYFRLANLYLRLNRLDDMRLVLETGMSKTGSARLRELYNTYFSDLSIEADSKPDQGNTLYLSDSLCQIIANFTYEDYRMRFVNHSMTSSSGTYCVKFGDFKGDLYFFNDNGVTTVNEASGAPYDTVRPNYVKLADLSYLFGGMASGEKVNVSLLSSIGATEISQKYDIVFGEYVSFIYNHCIIEIAIDSDGNFTNTSENRLYSSFANTTAEEKQFTNILYIVSATTGGGVANADVYIRQGGSTVCTSRTDGSGYCTVQLYPGEYTVEVNCPDYVVESFDLEVFTTGIASAESFIISPQLEGDQMRIVLEWGDYPSDLDSHLVDNTGVNRVNYTRKQWYDNNGNLIAELDVDDVTGYGPETITIYDTSVDFTYFVHDFSTTGQMFGRQDVTVKVYTSDNSIPTVYTIPLSGSSNYVWGVFSRVGGRISFINTELANRSDMRFYP